METEISEEELMELSEQIYTEAEADVAEKLQRIVNKYLVNHIPSLQGRATLTVILTRFRESLISQEAKDQITKAIKELNYESVG